MPLKGYRHTEEHNANISKNNAMNWPQVRAKHKAAVNLPEYKAKISAAGKGRVVSEETKAKMSKNNAMKRPEVRTKFIGENNPAKRPEVRAKISEALTGRKHTEEHRAKNSAAAKLRVGDKNSNWQGGKSFEPYCPLFNNTIKEKIRNRDGRVCQLCGKSEILNGEGLSIHHIDGDKMQGCDNTGWFLCALCRSCNSKADTSEKEFLIITNMRNVMQEVK